MWDAAATVKLHFWQCGRVCVISSRIDGRHLSSSLHYKGLAFDVRSRNIKPQTARLEMLAAIQELLGGDFNSFIEADHYHVEYDPK